MYFSRAKSAEIGKSRIHRQRFNRIHQKSWTLTMNDTPVNVNPKWSISISIKEEKISAFVKILQELSLVMDEKSQIWTSTSKS